MRALHVVHGLPCLDPAAGGTERYVAALVDATREPVLARDPGRDDGLRQVDDGVWSLGLTPPRDFRGTWTRPEAEAALDEVIDQTRPDLVHVHHLAHLGLGTGRRVVERGLPLVLTLHDYHHLCARGQLVDRDLSRCPGPEVDRCSACMGEHLRATPGLHGLGRLAGRLGLRAPARQVLARVGAGAREHERMGARLEAGRALFEGASRVISPSVHLGERLVAAGWLRRERLRVVDLPLVAPVRPAPPPGRGEVRFLFVGHLLPTKGVGVLVEAFQGLEGGELTVAGPQVPYDGRPGWAERLVETLGQTPRARYAGTFGDAERQAVFDAADVLVVPSTWEENSPLVVREAVAAGLRVVASAVGGVAEIDPQARLVPPSDPEALHTALRAEVARGRGRRTPRTFAMEPHVGALARVYEEAVSGAGSWP